MMTIWGLGGGVGVVGGGVIGQMLHNRQRAWMPLFVGACVAAAAFPIWFLINADVGRLPLALSFAAGFLGGALASPPGPNARYFIPLPDCCQRHTHVAHAAPLLWGPQRQQLLLSTLHGHTTHTCSPTRY